MALLPSGLSGLLGRRRTAVPEPEPEAPKRRRKRSDDGGSDGRAPAADPSSEETSE